MKDRSDKISKDYNSISQGFKIAVVLLLFFITLIRLALVFYFPSFDIISDKIFLSVLLFILFYLWIQEVVDFYRLVVIHKDLREAHEQLKEAEVDTVAALAKAEEAKDIYTRGHSERVTEISLAIADQMNLGDEAKKILSRAGILHDIGKIGISDLILWKKEKLTDEEWEIIKTHSQDGVKILEPLKFLAKERKIILEHHERYDGKGYPAGLKGNEVSREAYILSVADSFDAMNSERPYRKALSKDAIIAELNKARGTQHSPEVIDAFFALLEKRPELWEKR